MIAKMMTTKKCPKCNLDLQHSEYHRDRRTKSGLKNYCKPCSALVLSEVRNKKKAAMSFATIVESGHTKVCARCREEKGAALFSYNALSRDWLTTWCIDCKSKYDRERGKEPTVARRHKDANLKNRFGISVSEYDEILAEQGSACAICGGVNKNGKALAVDHDHETGEVRGLLCITCNSGIGKLRDSRDLLDRAIEYLDMPPLRRLRARLTSEEAA